jgi:hypothetical protein
MTTSHDHDKDPAAGLDSAARDLEVPEAVAERTVGGDLAPVTLKRGITTDNSVYDWRQGVSSS